MVYEHDTHVISTSTGRIYIYLSDWASSMIDWLTIIHTIDAFSKRETENHQGGSGSFLFIGLKDSLMIFTPNCGSRGNSPTSTAHSRNQNDRPIQRRCKYRGRRPVILDPAAHSQTSRPHRFSNPCNRSPQRRIMLGYGIIL